MVGSVECAKTRSFRAPHFLAHRHTLVTRASVTLSAAICRVQPLLHRAIESAGTAAVLSSSHWLEEEERSRNVEREKEGERHEKQERNAVPPRYQRESNGVLNSS